MNVGLYFDLRNPTAWRTDWSRLYGFTLEACEEAERLGCHSIWLSEHHLFDDGYLPQPFTMAAAVAARTRRVRIGTAIVIAPIHHPAELAEQAAIVDIISAGRIDVGIGAGYRLPEFELYGADFGRRYTATDRCATELRRLWDLVTPRPVQARVPIWMGYQGPQGAARAGRLGEGLLTVNGALWPTYRDALIAGGHGAPRARMAGGVQGWATDDPERDWPVVATHAANQLDSYRRYMVEGTGQPAPRPVDMGRLRERDPFSATLGYFLYGTPEHVAAKVRAALGDAPVETVYFWASLSGMPEDLVMQNIATVCGRLAPLLA
jgi:alkanesulfonate monooxygenase SsuD/methylene tetrahydromethanopterin reductase-like flavin-dependent oxidoreductase (luciferase family)